MGEHRKTHSNKIEISEADVVEAIQLIRRGLKIREVCEYLGYKKSTWYNRLEENPQIVTRFKRAKQTFHLELAEKARQLAMEGDKDMIKFLLTRRFNYTEKQEIEIKTKDKDQEMTRVELIQEIVKLTKRNKLPIADQLH